MEQRSSEIAKEEIGNYEILEESKIPEMGNLGIEGDRAYLRRSYYIESSEWDENENEEENEGDLEHLITEANVIEDSSVKDRSRLCYVCDTSKIDFFFDCGNGLCEECVNEHLRSQLDKYKTKILSNKISFVCAGSCKCHVDNHAMELLMTKEIKQLHNEVLLKMYLSKCPDVLQCPVSSCPNYGFVQCSSSDSKNCIECTVCGHSWEECSGNLAYNMVYNLKTMSFSLSNIKSTIKKYIITKYCNNCHSPIEKAEGCKHMECNRCEYSFCWRCTENWKVHKELACMGLLSNEYEESFRPEFLSTFLIFMIVVVVLKFVFTFTIIFYLLYLLIKLAVFCGFIVFDCFLIFGALYEKIRNKNNVRFYIVFSLILIVQSILYGWKLHPFSDRVYCWMQIGSCLTWTIVLIARRERMLR
jgi:hypothetical protein